MKSKSRKVPEAAADKEESKQGTRGRRVMRTAGRKGPKPAARADHAAENKADSGSATGNDAVKKGGKPATRDDGDLVSMHVGEQNDKGRKLVKKGKLETQRGPVLNQTARKQSEK
jgi:hypothetical protein